jgi:hypothetical protein
MSGTKKVGEIPMSAITKHATDINWKNLLRETTGVATVVTPLES